MDNYLYSSISGIVLVVHLIINWRQMFQRPQVKSDATSVEFRRFLICLLLFFVLDILWGIFAALKWPHILYVDTILFFLLMALVTAVIPFLSYTLGLRSVEASRAAILATVEPMVATLFGVLVFKEALTPLSALGIVLILAAVLLLNCKVSSSNRQS